MTTLWYPIEILRRAAASGRTPDEIYELRAFYKSMRTTRHPMAQGAWWVMGAAYPAELKP